MKRVSVSILAVLAGVSAAWAYIPLTGVGAGGFGINPLSPPSVIPQASALLGSDNAISGGGTNNAIKLASGALQPPTTAGNSWFIYVEGVVNDDPNWNQAATSPEYLFAKCASSACTGGSDVFVSMQPPSVSTSGGASAGMLGQLIYSQKLSGSQQIGTFNGGVAATGGPTHGSGYTNGFYGWTATGGGCTTEPSGIVGVGTNTSGQIDFMRITNAGAGCTSAPSIAIPSGAGSGTGGGIGLAVAGATYTGLTLSPGQRFCAIVGEYGNDSGVSYYQFVSAVDGNGNPLTGAPAVSTNNNSGWANRAGTTIGDVFSQIGSAYTTANSNQYGWGGQVGPVGMIWGVYPQTSAGSGIPDNTILGRLCKKDPTLSGGGDPYAYLSANFTAHSFYRLNDAGTWSDTSGHYGNATVLGSPTQGSPAAPGSAFTLADNGPRTTYPVTNYSTNVGTIKLSGTYSASLLGGTPSGVQAQISTTAGSCTAISGYGPGCAWTTLSSATISGGAWSGSLPSVPAGSPYYVSVRPSNGTSYVVAGSPVQVGLVIGWWGQSQMAYMAATQKVGNTLTTGPNNLAFDAMLDTNNTLQEHLAVNSSLYGGVFSHAGHWAIDAKSFAASSYVPVADGIGAFMTTLETLSGDPVEVVQLAFPAQPIEWWADGGVTVGRNSSSYCPAVTTSGSGAGPYTVTAAWAIGCLSDVGTMQTAVTVSNQIKAGTVKFYVGGVLAAVDSQTGALGQTGSTTCAGQNGFVVASCAITYAYGSNDISITFSTTPASAPTVTWTNIVAPVGTAGDDLTDVFGNGSPTSGMTSAVMARVPGGFSMFAAEQCSANSGEFSSNYAAGAASMTAKDSYLFGTKFPAVFPQVSASTPFMALMFPRDEQFPNEETGNIAGCTQWTRDLATSGSGYTYTGAGSYFSSGPYHDHAMLTLSGTSDNPHEGNGVFGGQRIGRRAGADAYAFLFGQTAITKKPVVNTATVSGCDTSATSSPCFDIGSTYAAHTSWTCSGTAGTSSNCIDIAFTLGATNATTLATCGTALSGGTCADGGLGEPVAGFRIGTASSPWSAAGLLADDGFDPYANTFPTATTGQTTGLGFQCVLVSATVVQCHKSTGSWSSGTTYINYGDFATATRFGRLGGVGTSGTANYAGGGSYTVTAAGTSCTTANGVVNVSQSGETATGGSKGTIQFVISSNSVIAAFPQSPGENITANGTISYPPGCSGSTITLPSNVPGTQNTDLNIAGQYLYDNAASSTPLSTVFGSNEPGNPALPFGTITAVQVSG